MFRLAVGERYRMVDLWIFMVIYLLAKLLGITLVVLKKPSVKLTWKSGGIIKKLWEQKKVGSSAYSQGWPRKKTKTVDNTILVGGIMWYTNWLI